MALLSREPETKKPDAQEDGDEELTIRPREVVVLPNAFREGNGSSLLSSIQIDDQAEPAAATLGC